MHRNFYFLLIVLAGCQPAERKNPLEKFKGIDSSLKTTDSLQLSRRKSFDTSGKFLAGIFDSTLFQIFMLRKKLAEADPTLERLNIGDSLLVKTVEGRNLYRRLKTCYELSKNKKTPGMKNLNEFSLGEEQWLHRYFHTLPTIAIITILSKLQADVQKAQ